MFPTAAFYRAVGMSEGQGAFDWIALPGGRARFCGGVRGAEQRGHEAFAVEVDGRVFYGEIRKRWLDDRCFALEVVSFGYRVIENIGVRGDAADWLAAGFTHAQWLAIEQRVADLVAAILRRESRPFVLSMEQLDDFSGEIHFPRGGLRQVRSFNAPAIPESECRTARSR